MPIIPEGNMVTMFWGGVLIVFQLLLTIVISLGAFYFKQLRQTIEEYKTSVEKRMKEGEERFERIEESLSALRGEVYKDYVTKPDLIRIMGSLEFKFREVTELIEKLFTSTKGGEKN
ncbi:MAG: hypothetical protein AB1847_16725 [bacterium]